MGSSIGELDMQLVDFVLSRPPIIAPTSKLRVYTEEKRAEIVKRHQSGESVADIAADFGVRYQSISQVLRDEYSETKNKY